MKKLIIFVLALILVLSLTSCATSQQSREQNQQAAGVASITDNQPVPDLGGFSLERQIVIQTYLARNRAIATYAYMFTMDGKIVEICPSIGYPIPYSTELTSPNVSLGLGQGAGYQGSVVANPEPNGLYPPGDAAATLVQCVNPDGTVTPVYIEWYVLAFPYRIQSDYQLQRIGDTSFSVDITRP